MKKIISIISCLFIIVYFVSCGGSPSSNDSNSSGSDDLTPIEEPTCTYLFTKVIKSVKPEFSLSDKNGNIYVVGHFWNTVNFAEHFNLTDSKTSSGSYDAFITKISSDGTYCWTKRIGGTSSDTIYKLYFDSSDNVYVLGYFRNTVNFKADWGGASDSKTSNGLNDIFITKINSDGTYAWTHTIGGSNDDYCHSIAIDASNNIWIKGEFSGSVNFSSSWGGTDVYDFPKAIFVTKINSNETYGFTRIFENVEDYYFNSLCCDSQGNVYILNYFKDTVNFSEYFSAPDDIKISKGGHDISITKLDPNGYYCWTKRIGGSGEDAAYHVNIDNNSNIYIVGYFNGTVNFSEDWGSSDIKTTLSSDYNAFVTKLDPYGSYLWTKQIKSENDCLYRYISFDNDDNCFVTGFFSDTINFGNYWGMSDIKSSQGRNDFVVTMLKSDGSYCWSKRIGGRCLDLGISLSINGDFLYLFGFLYDYSSSDTINFSEDWNTDDVFSGFPTVSGYTTTGCYFFSKIKYR